MNSLESEQQAAADRYCGLSDAGIVSAEYFSGVAVHERIITPLQTLAERASEQGFELSIASGFRSFERQLLIWNAKAEGLRPVLDDNNRPIDLSPLSLLERVQAIMRFSALPGASRHHWGCDIDVYDRAALPEHQSVQLLPSESQLGGVFYDFHQWLDSQFNEGAAEGFYRPYNIDRGGVAVEPWHISYAPMAAKYQQGLTVEVLAAVIDAADIGFKATILDNLPSLFQRFIALPPVALHRHC